MRRVYVTSHGRRKATGGSAPSTWLVTPRVLEPKKPEKEVPVVKVEEPLRSPALNGEDIQALAINLDNLKKTSLSAQASRGLTHRQIRRTRHPDDARAGVRVSVARPLPQDMVSVPLELPGGPRYDEHGMVLPHSILGSLEDFRKEMEARGETELVMRIPTNVMQKQPPVEDEIQASYRYRTKSCPQAGQIKQIHALQNWEYHMAERQRQQDFISRLLQLPVENLLMNRMKKFQDPDEECDLMIRGYSVQRFINVDSLEELNFNQTFPCPSGQWEEEREKEEEIEGEDKDSLALEDDVKLDPTLGPALRLDGELAFWTGSTTSHQGEVGISKRLTFETDVGESVCCHLNVKNEGSTAIYYRWEKLTLEHSFHSTLTDTQNFYFNTATGVITPGQTEKIEIIFKSMSPGIMTELWQLHTLPVLMGGASLQVTMRGTALIQDKTIDLQKAMEKKLEHNGAIRMCKSMLCEVVRGIHSPERPSSPGALSEEENFHIRNPKLLYHYETIELLKSLWEEAHRSQVTKSGESDDTQQSAPAWDLSLDSLRQVLLSLPEEDADAKVARLCREDALSQLNSLVFQLHQPQLSSNQLTTLSIGLKLWRNLLEGMDRKAQWLKQTLGHGTAQPQLQLKYRHQLRGQVYILMENLVNSLCDCLDEAEQNEADHQKAQ